MNALEKFYGGAFFLVLVFLLVKNPSGVNTIFNALANFNAKTFSVLQGNNVSSFG